MNFKQLAIILLLTLFSCDALSKIVRIEQDGVLEEYAVKTESPFYVFDTTPTLYITSGIGRRVILTIENGDGLALFSYDNPEIQFTDTFTLDSVKYQGVIVETVSLPADSYSVNLKIYDDETLISSYRYDLNIDGKPPEITGEFFWDSYFQHYHDVHTDGKFIISLTQVKAGGFSSHIVGDSAIDKVTFSSRYLDGNLAGTYAAEGLPARILDGAVVIGDGTKGSVSYAYIPDRHEAEMELTYTIYALSGASFSRSINVYVDTLPTTVAPTPYGIFTGDDVQLDNNPVFDGFVPYVPGMSISTNPIRMLYQAPRSEYVGGGGRADIYGGWLRTSDASKRGENGIVYRDDDYLYYDITATSTGSQMNVMDAFTKDLMTWRRSVLTHDLHLEDSAVPPVAKNLDIYVKGLDKWFNSHSTTGTVVYITKEETDYKEDEISEIRITVEPRSYTQRFNFSFTSGDPNYYGDCLVEPGESTCSIMTSLPFPGDEINVYHNRHIIRDMETGMKSNELVSNWRYDGFPAQIDYDSVHFEPELERFSVVVTKDFANRVWSQAKIRNVLAYAVDLSSAGNVQTDIPDESARHYLPSTSEDSEAVNEVNRYNGTFSYESLKEGDYAIYLYVEDGFNSNYKHTNDYYIETITIGDKSPPDINYNVTENEIVDGLTAIVVSLVDSSDAWIDDILLSGGPASVNMSLPFSDHDDNQYRIEHVYIDPSDSVLYSLTVKAQDEFQNATEQTVSFYYVPPTIQLPDIELAAIASAARSINGIANNVLLTSEVRDNANSLAIGNHVIYFTLLPSAEDAFYINGELVAPGQTVLFNQNLSDSSGKIRFVVYPEHSGQLTEADYQITVPEVRVQVCPRDFTPDSERCIFVDVKSAEPSCSTDYSLSDDGAVCSRVLTYTPDLVCDGDYQLDINSLTCSGFIERAPVAKCPSGTGNITTGCRKHEAVDAQPCPDGHYIENGTCTDGSVVSEFGHYCAGFDVSTGSVCDEDGICYTYEKDWAACEKVTLVDAVMHCHEGSFVNGACRILDTYTLHGTCEPGFTIVDGQCERLDIVDPTMVCEEGATPSPDGMVCTSVYYEPFIGCPSGYEFIDDRCYQVVNSETTCAEGTLVGGRCEKETSLIPVHSCQQQHKLIDGFCHLLSQPTLTCSEGSLTGGSCTVTDTVIPQSCASGYHYQSGQCFDLVNKTTECGTGYTMDNGVCSRVDSTYTPALCPDGYYAVQNSVSSNSDSSSSLQPIASVGEGAITCHQIVDYATESVCPSMYTYVDDACYINSDYSFAPEFENVLNLTLVDYKSVCTSKGNTYITHNDSVISCFEPEFILANSSCEVGDVLNGDGDCEVIVETAPVDACPTGYTSHSQAQCIGSTHISSALVCQSGYQLSSESELCVQTSSNDAYLVCDSSSSLDGNNQCVSNVPDLSAGICNVGSLQSDGTCKEIAVTDVSHNCLSNYVLQADNTCISQNPADSVGLCSVNGVSESNRCAFTSFSALLQSCASDFTLNNGQCTRLLNQPIDFSCGDNEEASGGSCHKQLNSSSVMLCDAPYYLVAGDECERRVDIKHL